MGLFGKISSSNQRPSARQQQPGGQPQVTAGSFIRMLPNGQLGFDSGAATEHFRLNEYDRQHGMVAQQKKADQAQQIRAQAVDEFRAQEAPAHVGVRFRAQPAEGKNLLEFPRLKGPTRFDDSSKIREHASSFEGIGLSRERFLGDLRSLQAAEKSSSISGKAVDKETFQETMQRLNNQYRDERIPFYFSFGRNSMTEEHGFSAVFPENQMAYDRWNTSFFGDDLWAGVSEEAKTENDKKISNNTLFVFPRSSSPMLLGTTGKYEDDRWSLAGLGMKGGSITSIAKGLLGTYVTYDEMSSKEKKKADKESGGDWLQKNYAAFIDNINKQADKQRIPVHFSYEMDPVFGGRKLMAEFPTNEAQLNAWKANIFGDLSGSAPPAYRA